MLIFSKMVTVAILGQGTNWADAVTQADLFLCGATLDSESNDRQAHERDRGGM